MDIDIVNKISNLAIHGYYEQSNNTVIVHFYNPTIDKRDLVAYLLPDMSWDLREIVEEKVQLLADKELIEILHSPVGIFPRDSTFDQFVRKGLTSIAKQIHGEDKDLTKLDKVFEIFEKNSY